MRSEKGDLDRGITLGDSFIRTNYSFIQPRGMVRGGRREEGSGWGTRVYLWQIHVDIWQNQYNIVKLKNKKKLKQKKP